MDCADDFFVAPTFLAWLPGETLFSLVSRHHFFWGHPLSARTCEQFFGHPRAGSQHDLPSRLSRFVSCTGGCFGDVEKIAKNHTLLAYYAAFIPADELENAIACMGGDSVAHLKLRLGILTSRFRANHPLKACEVCRDEDRTEFGWAYWHVEHQYPGVWMCLKHGQLLKESNLKATGVERFQWHVPAKERFRDLSIEKQNAISHEIVAIQNLSQQVIDLVRQPSVLAIDSGRLHEVYRAELVRRGWVTAGGSYRVPEIAASFLEHVRRLRVLPELEALPSTSAEAVTQLGRMLRPPRSGTHPLRHLVLVNWLFRSAESFGCAYASACGPSVKAPEMGSTPTSGPATDDRDPRRDDLVRMVTTENLSLRKAALTIGIDIGTAMSWAAKAGLPVPRRPKKLSGDVGRKTIADLQNGADKATAAKNAGVSVVTITKLLLSGVGLHAAWNQSREMRARALARGDWTQLLQTHGRLGVKLMRAMNPATYAWLYRNDRAWLDAHKPDRLEPTATSGMPRVLWDVRDAALSVEVERIVLDLRQVAGARQIKLWQIYQALPALKAKLAALDRLPLTRRAIESALKRRGGDISGEELFG